MQKLRNIFDRIWAAFIFFTRLPLWRLHQPPKECYSTVVEHWPLTGWLTGGLMAAIIFFGSMVIPMHIAVILAICARLLLTGALHEDGLADFCDGMGGGGSDRERILAIMKDSHIGTYGVLGLILYLLLLFATLTSLSPQVAALAVLAADPYAKMLTSQLVLMLPYARKEEEAKNRTIYRKFSMLQGISLFVQGMAPLVLFILLMQPPQWSVLLFVPAIVFYMLYMLINHRLHAYTGDCCGAVCLLVELSMYLFLNFNA
jgi:adenosylcobinamide-GDP ribazoletransferase